MGKTLSVGKKVYNSIDESCYPCLLTIQKKRAFLATRLFQRYQAATCVFGMIFFSYISNVVVYVDVLNLKFPYSCYIYQILRIIQTSEIEVPGLNTCSSFRGHRGKTSGTLHGGC